MADVTLFVHDVQTIEVRCIESITGRGDTYVVDLKEEGTTLHVSGWHPESVVRGRAVAAAINAACAAAEDSQRRVRAVPIESLAPDDLTDLAAPTVLAEDDIEHARRTAFLH